MTEFIKLKTPQETIQFGFTTESQRSSWAADTSRFLHRHRFDELLVKVPMFP